jgi:hypothetical protein
MFAREHRRLFGMEVLGGQRRIILGIVKKGLGSCRKSRILEL